MSTGGPELFVICKSCGSEVSPYITECPYCGNRLRKRAPKLDREGRVTERRRRRLATSAVLPRLRRDEIPGILVESRPYATIALVAAGVVGALIWRTGAIKVNDVIVMGQDGKHWWRLLTAPFIYNTPGYAFVSLVPIMLYGWLLERRHGRLPVLALFLIGGVGGTTAASAADPNAIILGGNGAALALLCAWAVPDALALAAGEEIEGDLQGTLAIAVVVALTPLAVTWASWIAGAVGVLGGLLLGFALARLQPR